MTKPKDPTEILINQQRTTIDRLERKVVRLEQRLQKRSRNPLDILVIGDSHSKPGVSNERYKWAAKLANKYRPDVIVEIGDWADMQSLFALGNERGKQSFEGACIQDDIEAAREARQLFAETLSYKPRLISTMGNHEGRINRFVEMFPIHAKTYTTKRLGAEEFGWEVIPYGEVAVIGGVCFTHTPLNPTTGKEIGGIHKAHAVLAKGLMSCVFGHDHCRSEKEWLRTDHSKAIAVGVGCYFEHEEVYAGPGGNSNWWRGLCLLRSVEDGYGHAEFIPLEDVKKKFG